MYIQTYIWDEVVYTYVVGLGTASYFMQCVCKYVYLMCKHHIINCTFTICICTYIADLE